MRVCALYPDLMNIYADRGNLTVFERRCAWRGMGFELAGAGIGDEIDPDAHDLFYLGGGQDRDQALCARDLATVKRDALHAAADRGAVVFAVCGGLQLLGHGYEMEDERLPGVGLVDLDTKREDGPRLLGNIAIALDLPGGPAMLAGLREPRGPDLPRRGRRAARPGRSRAHGNNGRDGTEGVRGGRTGPWSGPTCTARCCRRTRRSPTGSTRTALGLGALPPLDDALEDAAHAEAARAAGVGA